MSTESENLYTKNDQLIAQIYDNLSGENKSEEAISLLLNPNHISPTEQVKILGLLGEKDERFHSLLIKTVLNNINILDNNESFKIINNHFIQLVNQAYLLDDNEDLSRFILSYKSRCSCILSIYLDTAKKPWSYHNIHRQEIKNHQPLCSRFQFRWVQC